MTVAFGLGSSSLNLKILELNQANSFSSRQVEEMKSLKKEDIQGVCPSNVHSLFSSWNLPDSGCLKLNSDAVFETSSRADFRVVITNSSGLCLAVSFGPCHAYSPVKATFLKQ
uniref:Uncharacterized protein n=1 Tax=Nelumbo nucifera TaxID=4432 RepID=A0A822XZE9_NELNU|nr:TPA_asm: hypothetical protein HUJ06_025903 [Nelumbo nucifera]